MLWCSLFVGSCWMAIRFVKARSPGSQLARTKSVAISRCTCVFMYLVKTPISRISSRTALVGLAPPRPLLRPVSASPLNGVCRQRTREAVNIFLMADRYDASHMCALPASSVKPLISSTAVHSHRKISCHVLPHEQHTRPSKISVGSSASESHRESTCTQAHPVALSGTQGVISGTQGAISGTQGAISDTQRNQVLRGTCTER